MNDESVVLQEIFPVAPVPLCGSLPEAQEGVRYHVASDGLWREVRTPWLSVVAPVARSEIGTTPFGELTESVELTVCPPKNLWSEFLAQAKADFPQESAGVFAWHKEQNTWRHVARIPVKATGSFIHYQEPVLDDQEIAVVDLHSHGRHDAFFSATDNDDDRGGIKVSVVFGNIGADVSLLGRLVVLDHTYPLSVDGQGEWHVGARV